MKDCRECQHGQLMSYHQRLCTVMTMAKPIEYMRDLRSDCGPEAMLFEPRDLKRYAEADDL